MGNCCKSTSKAKNGKKSMKHSKLSIPILIENEDAEEQNEEHECKNNEKPEPEPEPQHGLRSFHFGYEAIGIGCQYAQKSKDFEIDTFNGPYLFMISISLTLWQYVNSLQFRK